jgi:hypothetical protein
MKNNKKLDCVKMKRDIQQQIQKEYSGLSDKEAYRIQMDKVMQNPILESVRKVGFCPITEVWIPKYTPVI